MRYLIKNPRQPNRHDRRRIESMLAHRTTSDHERRVLTSLGVPDVYRRNGRIVIPDVPADCFDVWRERADEALVMFTRPVKVRAVHVAAGLRGWPEAERRMSHV